MASNHDISKWLLNALGGVCLAALIGHLSWLTYMVLLIETRTREIPPNWFLKQFELLESEVDDYRSDIQDLQTAVARIEIFLQEHLRTDKPN